MSRPMLTLSLIFPGFQHAIQAASNFRGGGRWCAIRRRRLLHATDSRARGCQVAERVEVKTRKFEGYMGKHAARSQHMVRKCFAPSRAVMLTRNRCPDRR